MKATDRIRPAALLMAVLILLSATGCTQKTSKVTERTGFLFDTIVTVKLWFDGDADMVMDGVFDLCSEYDRMFDRNDPDSDIGRINLSGGAPCAVSEDTAELISIALDYSRLSDGLFDITCGRVTALWDFNTDTPSLPDTQLLSDALATVNWQNVKIEGCTVTVPEGTQLDLGGIAKGYIADRAIEYLEQCGVQDAVVNLGGNVRVLGDKNGQLFSVGIQSPFDEGGNVGVLDVSDCSVVTAGSYQRSFTLNNSHYHHILDLSDGMPADTGLASVTIISDSSVQADALATICFLMGADDGMRFIRTLDGVQAVFITDDGQLLTTDGLESSFRPY